tara:strand:- start:825 stop:1064 length:240 start_codon:yes stop_codon:yes gene_type:complete
MLDNNLIFSLVLSLINTGIFIALTHKDNFEQKKQEYIMLFGITFVSSFMLKMLLSSDLMKGGSPSLGSEVLIKSSRPPF